ncbi:MAG: DUF2846 domain-containing protein [Verrucomicrobia bacterium]|nr:DUF2846 domain-containing protein [Verrucomicrobiota bacterium]
MKNLAVILLLLLFFCGCETPPSQSAIQPPRRLGADAATIYLLRTPGPGVLISGIIKVDGFEVGRMKHSTYCIIHVTPGKHKIEYTKPGWTLEFGAKADIMCQAGCSYYMIYGSRMAITSFGGPAGATFSNQGDMFTVSEAEGKATMAELSLAFTYGEKEANLAPVPTPMSDTPAADAPVAPAAAHL